MDRGRVRHALALAGAAVIAAALVAALAYAAWLGAMWFLGQEAGF